MCEVLCVLANEVADGFAGEKICGQAGRPFHASSQEMLQRNGSICKGSAIKFVFGGRSEMGIKFGKLRLQIYFLAA